VIRRRPALARDERGATLVEFAIVAPVMLLLLFGLFELSYRIYLQSVLTGAMQRAGRAAALETGGSTAEVVNNKVMEQIRPVATNATFTSTRKAYYDYKSIAPEPFTDTNNNGARDAGECYSDVNANGSWDQDPGRDGLGGANDSIVYTMKVTYPRIFPLTGWIGGNADQVITASTILKNQPYSAQGAPTPATLCT
jgi:Flp pilus assembly protein TadG